MLTQKEIIEVRKSNIACQKAYAEALGKGCIELVLEDEPREDDFVYVELVKNPETGEREAIIE